jgi:uncharacterized membrane protein YtjA (UPF0391 family)
LLIIVYSYDTPIGRRERSTPPPAVRGDLIGLAILFLILAVIAAVVGASGVAGISMQIAAWLVIIFAVLAVVTFVL